jgi:hypothetical protein
MNANDDVEQRISDFYAAEEPSRAPSWLLESALATIDSTPQRRAVIRLPRRFSNMNSFAKLAIAAVVVIAVGAVGLALFRPGSTPAVGGLPPSPSPTILPSLPPQDGAVDGGRHTLAAGFPVPITFDVPADWQGCSPSPVEQAVCGPSPENVPSSAVGFAIIDNVVADPCGTALKAPPVGPSVDDLVTAISGLNGFKVTSPVDITLDGYAGKQIEVTTPAAPTCELLTWATSNRTNGVGPGEVNLVRIYDVGGVRVLISGAYHPDTGGPNAGAEVQEVMDSVQIGG